MITQVVQQVIRVADEATGPLRSVAGAAAGVTGAVTRTLAPIGALVSGLASVGTVRTVARLGSQFEDTQIAVAGMLTALGETSDFNSGLRAAETTMVSINRAAAALPGEAEDYIEVFRASLPQVRAALGGTLQQSVDFSNQLAAVGITFGLNATVIGRQTAAMLSAGRGRATAANRMFASMLPFMRQVQGQANLTTQSFNAMTSPQRARLLQQTLRQLQPMLDASANSMSALWGATASNTKQLLRVGTAPLFAEMKNTLRAINGYMDTNNTSLVSMVTLVSEHLAAGLRRARAAVAHMAQLWRDNRDAILGVVQAVRDRLQPALSRVQIAMQHIREHGVGNTLREAGTAAGHLGVAALAGRTALAAGPGIASGIGALASMGGAAVGTAPATMLAVLLAPVVLAMAEGAIDLRETWSQIRTFGMPVVSMLQELWTSLKPLVVLVGQNTFQVFTNLVDAAAPLVGLLTGLGYVLTFFVSLPGVIIQAFQEQFPRAASILGGAWSDAIMGPLGGLAAVGRSVRQFSDGRRLHGGDRALGGPDTSLRTDMDSIATGWGNQFAQSAAAATAAQRSQARTPPSHRGSGPVYDFRNSRFDITQRFAEGFDPDRVAVAFANDLARLGDQRLQSGLEPAGGVH